MSRRANDNIRFNDLSLTSTSSEESSNLSVTTNMIQENKQNILKISIEDLDYVEADLEFYEKVPVVFLLYAHKFSVLALQKLLTEIRNASLGISQSRTTVFSDWARKDNQWRDKFLEALCIVNVNHAIVKLGLHLQEIRERFLPHIPESNLYIHPVLKALHIVAENLTFDEARDLIQYVNDRSSIETSSVVHNYTEFLEINCLNWIQRSVIKLGDWTHDQPNKNIQQFCDLDVITSYLKKIPKFEHLEHMLHNVSIRLNFTKHNQIAFETTGGKRANQMDKMGDPIPPPETYVKTQMVPTSSRNVLPPTLSKSDSRYPITRKNAGYLIIINQNEFTQSPNGFRCSKRDGTNNDKDMLIRTFSQFGYFVKVGNDLKSHEIFPFIRDVVELSKNKDSLIICILSHGTKGTFYASDSVAILISSIVDAITVKELKEKPKLIIVQACQDEENKFENLKYGRGGLPDVENRFECFQMISSVPGFTSYRNPTQGSLFIQILCQVIQKHKSEKSIVSIFCDVCDIFKNVRGRTNEKMCPKLDFSASKEFFFPAQ